VDVAGLAVAEVQLLAGFDPAFAAAVAGAVDWARRRASEYGRFGGGEPGTIAIVADDEAGAQRVQVALRGQHDEGPLAGAGAVVGENAGGRLITVDHRGAQTRGHDRGEGCGRGFPAGLAAGLGQGMADAFLTRQGTQFGINAGQLAPGAGVLRMGGEPCTGCRIAPLFGGACRFPLLVCTKNWNAMAT